LLEDRAGQVLPTLPLKAYNMQ